MKSHEERREERRQFENDVFYEVWRAGGNPDAIDYERVDDRYYDGQDVQIAAEAELRAQQPKKISEDGFCEQLQDEEPE